jgi:hypothetical protein
MITTGAAGIIVTTDSQHSLMYICGDMGLHWYKDKDGYTLMDDGYGAIYDKCPLHRDAIRRIGLRGSTPGQMRQRHTNRHHLYFKVRYPPQCSSSPHAASERRVETVTVITKTSKDCGDVALLQN